MTIERIRSIPADATRGYKLEVDMHLPSQHHERMANYPLAPEKKAISGSQLSEYQRQILREQFTAKNGSLSEEIIEEKVDEYSS